MIILDTNILWGMSLRGSSAELLRAIRASNVERVAVPELVMVELAAKQALAYQEKYEAADKALRDLKRATPWGGVQGPGQRDLERVRAQWRKEYGHLVDVIPMKEDAYREGAYREANQIAPCRTVRSNSRSYKIGARDAAIWLTAVDYAHDHDDEMIYFVSGNTTDFGDGTTLPDVMFGDIVNVADRFEVLTSLDEVISRFTKPAEADAEQVEEALRTPSSLATITEYAASTTAFTHPFVCNTDPDRGVGVESHSIAGQWIGPPSVALDSVRDVSAHSIGSHVWCTATVRWLLHGFGALYRSPDCAIIGLAWETRVLLSPTGAEPKLTFLRHTGPRLLRPDDVAHLPSLWSEASDSEAGEPGPVETELLLHLLRNDAGARSLQEMQLKHWMLNWHPTWRYQGRHKPSAE
ncbi:PIN domain-containing protein [Streptomyces albidoflavus]|uniref:PIN domain-containing protein n=1 Tax=Streptomyces albidoflavus TaxID=1886 RepID=UPI0038B3529B|nr:PIN domain-containing protein [Streptomyces albidoflavus]